jgi:hypothetical protein
MSKSYRIKQFDPIDPIEESQIWLWWESTRRWNIVDETNLGMDPVKGMRHVTILPPHFGIIIEAFENKGVKEGPFCEFILPRVGLAEWTTILKIYFIGDKQGMRIEEYWSEDPERLRGSFRITLENFKKLKEEAETTTKAKPVHYINIKNNEVVFDRDSFEEGD